MRQRTPNTLITNPCAVDRAEEIPIQIPPDRLALPVARRPVPLHAPRMPPLVREARAAGQAVGLVARPTGVAAAVHGAVARQLPVDRLEDVHLAALRPAGAVALRV